MPITREERLKRTALLLDDCQLEALRHAHVMLFGLGGVGSFAAEALARVGVGRLTLVDSDTVAASNVNRQLPALQSTVGRLKTEVMLERLRDIAPDADIRAINAFYLPDAPVPIPEDCTAVADAIDTVAAKLHLAELCAKRGIPLVSCMGMGNRLDPTRIRVGDLYETSGCPLCRVMRQELRKRGVSALRCVYSTEPALVPRAQREAEAKETGRPAPGSISFVPSVAGLYMAYELVRVICQLKGSNEKNSVKIS
ncbi:MAG: tRNA threonylcarbamoyladenosine dehydratase [Clostridia bacterium]